MKKILYIAVAILASSVAFISCDDEETYADQKEREARQIRKWISDNDIDVISLSDFLKDTVTNNPETGPDFTRNEYVLFTMPQMEVVKIQQTQMLCSSPGARSFSNDDGLIWIPEMDGDDN